MSQRQVIGRSRRQRVRSAVSTVIVPVPVIRNGGRGALLSGTALVALVACGLFSFNDRALAQNAAQLPTGGTVVGGSATITQNGTSQLTVNQTTDRGVIDWRSFSIGQGNRVDFIQPGRGSVTLNRVTGADPSVIAGSLNANGQIVLVNQAGVFFGGGAQVNVESLIASTANVTNPAAFMAGGKIAFDQAGANPNARIVNDGTITVRDGGLVALLGPSAANNGVINARLGRVTVGGAETFTVDLNGDGLVNFAVGNPVSQTPRDADGKALALASNTGTINADGGVVAITASAAREVVNGVVNVQGQINARTVQNEGGVIVFGGGETTQVNVGGTIDVSGAGAAQKGGTVHVTASKVNVQSTARVNANGGAGGGTVLVGGGKQGAGPIANAKNTTVAKGAVITADATHKGNGGQVIIWADNTTVFAGTISANGGPQGGNGGFVETSGRVTLSLLDGAMISVGAPAGAGGLWLMDPTNLTLDNAAVTTIEGTLAGGGSVLTQTVAGGAEDGNITLAANLSTTVLANQDVTWTIQAHGKIDLGSKSISITPFVGKNSNLVLDTVTLASAAVDRSISGTGAITTTTLTATSGGSVSLTGTVALFVLNFNANGAVTVNDTANDISNIATSASSATGAVTIVSTEVTTIASGGINANAATLNISTTGAGDNIVLTGAVKAASVTLNSAGNLSGAGTITATGAVSLKAATAGGINLSGAIAGTGLTVQANNGPVTLSSTDNAFNSFTAAAAIGGTVTVMHNGGLTINGLNVGSDAASFTTNTAGDITVGGNITAADLVLNAAGTLAINAQINVAGGAVGLTGASITQTAAGVITTGTLGVTSAGSVNLSAATSSISTLVGNVGSIAFLESNGFAISEAGSIVGLTASGTVQLSAGGSITQDRLISAASLAVRTSAGDIDLTGATNSVGTFAAKATAGFVALLEANDVQIGAVGAVGALAALDGITANNGVSIRTLAGSVTQTATGVITAGAAGLAVSVAGGNIVLDTAVNATASIAFNSPGTAAYMTSSDLNVGQVAALGGNAQVTGATATTSLTLRTNGAATSIAQSKAISTGTLTLGTGAGGQITLTDSGNLIGTVQSSGTLGTAAHTISDSDGGLNVGPITSSGDVALITSGGGLTITGLVNVGASTLALTANGNNAITATAAAITAGKLTLETGTGGKADIQTAAHNVAIIQTAGTGVGTGGIVFNQVRALGTAVGPITSGGTVTITDGSGAITVSGAIVTTSDNVTLLATSNKLNINAQINTTNGQVALLAQGDITQANAGAGISADSLRGESTGGNVILAPTGLLAADVNVLNTTFAARADAGSVSFRSSGTFTVGKVNNTSGISAAVSVSLTLNDSAGFINQAAGADGAIITPTLNLTTFGANVTINSASNDIGALGTVDLAAGALTFSTARALGFSVGTVTADGGIDITNTAGNLSTTSAITSNGNISLRSTTGALALGGTVTSNNKGITLRSAGALDTGGAPVSAPTLGTGDVTLISDTSTVTIGAGGVNVGDTLTIQIGAGLTLNVAGPITGAASVALHADAIEISASIGATGTITLAPVTAGTAVTVGGAAGAGFVIDSNELTFLTSASTLTIGKQSTGATTAGAITVAGATVGNAALNLFSTAGVSQTGGLTVGGGTGALNVVAAGDVNLATAGVSIGSISGGSSNGFFHVLNFGGGGLTINAIDNTGGQVIFVDNSAGIMVSGAINTNGRNLAISTVGGALTINKSITAAGASVGIQGSSGISQSASGTITSANLIGISTGASVTLNADNAVTGNVTLLAASGNVAFTNTLGFTVGGISTIVFSGFGTFPSGGATASGMRASGSVTLTTGGTVVQATGVNDIISAGTLIINRVGAANPTVTLDNANNTVTSLGTVSIGTGAFTLVDQGGLSLTGAVTAGSFSAKTDFGSLTQNVGATIDTSASNGTVTLTTTTAGSINLNGNINVGAGLVSLNAAGAVSQGIGAITAKTVSAVGAASFVSLTSATNAFSEISGSSGGGAGFSATTTKSLTSGAITTVGGIATLTTTGGTSDLTVDGLISGVSTLTLASGHDVLQTATGGVSASSLQVNATNGAVDLTIGAANNNVATLAGQSSGNFAYTDGGTSALAIGTVSTVGITSTNGDITILATKAGAKLSVTQLVKASGAGGDVSLQSAGDVTFTAGLTATGRVSLTSTAGSINQGSGAGVITGAELLANAAINVDLSIGGHSVGASGFAATATTGYVAFLNNTALNIDTVGGTNGVTAGGAVFIGVSTGDLTQTATGIITAGAGLGLFAFDGSIVFDAQNLITGNVAVVSSPNANVTIRNKGNLNVGQVGPITIFGGGSFTADGILASTAAGKFVSLISDTGVVTQSAAASSRIQGAELRITTTNNNATLDNTSNAITAVGNSNLGAGRLVIFDGVGDLTLSDPVVANGGVILTTQTTFNLPGAISVANGDISLTSVTGNIALGSTLSAANGQIQLDAGGAAGTISQTGGTITANSLIVRAPGSVTLTEANNDVGTIAGRSTTGTFTYVDKTAVTVGSLTDSSAVAVTGITTANQDVIVVAGGGGGAGGITVNQAINAGTAIVRLETSQGDISQAATGLVTAGSVLANAATGSVNLAAVANAVTFWAGKSGGSFRVLTVSQLGVTDIAADGGALTTAGTGIIANGDVALQTSGTLGLLSGINAGSGTVRLSTTGGGIIAQLASGPIVANALLIDATGAVTLTASLNNDVNTIAGRTTSGAFRYQDKNGFTVGSIGADGAGLGPVLAIGPMTGVATAGGDITLAAGGLLTINEAINAGFGGGTIRLQTGAGDLTQGVSGTLTGGSLLAVSTGGMVNLTGATNTVTGIAGSAFTSFLFQNSVGYAVSNVALASDGIVAAATGITANSGGAGSFVVDLAVASGTLAINGPVSSANGMIIYRRTPTGAPGAINVGGGAGNPGNDIGSARLLIIDHTGASPLALYGAVPSAGAGGLFVVPTPGTGFSPLTTPGTLTGGTSTVGELNALNSTVYVFGSAANFQSLGGGGSTFGLLGIYGQSNTVNLTTSVRAVDPNLVRAITAPFTEPLTSGALAAFHVRHDGLATATEQFNSCPIGTINCVVFTTPIAAPSVSTDDVVIGVAGAPLDDSGIVLVNQGNEDLMIDTDEEKKKKRTPQ